MSHTLMDAPAAQAAYADLHGHQMAADAALADMDYFSEWLAGYCIFKTDVDSSKALRSLAGMVAATPCVQLHAAITCAAAGDDAAAGRALRLVLAEYLSHNARRRVGEKLAALRALA